MTKKTLLWISVAVLGLLALFGVTYAAGGGGGGGGGGGNPACTADRFDCTQWTDCSPFGEQVRTCQLISDCASVDDPLPVMKRACTPPEPVKKETPAAPPSVAVCTKDEYQCGAWGVCEEDGMNRRTCALVKDCPGVKTPVPAQEQACAGLQCGQLPTLQKRAECRLKLTPEQTKHEQEILYAPEYCKLEKTTQEKKDCIALYKSLEPCWALPAGAGREACGKQVTGMAECEAKKATCTDKSCSPEMKQVTEKWTLFQIYEFEFLAESLMKAGKASLKDTAAHDVWIERQKAKMEKTTSVKAWAKILSDSKAGWDKFAKAHALPTGRHAR